MKFVDPVFKCILPTITYNAETWTLTHKAVYINKVAQKAMQRAMLGTKLIDRVPNFEIRTKVIGDQVTTRRCAEHIAWHGEDRWGKASTE